MVYLDSEDEKKSETILNEFKPFMEEELEKYRQKIVEATADNPRFTIPLGNPDIPALRTKLIQIMIRNVKSLPNDMALHQSGEYYINIYNDYLELIYNLSKSINMRQDKITFCLYAGINQVVYNTLMTDGEENQVQAFQTIDSCLIDETLTGIENKTVNKAGGEMRLKARGVGHSIDTEPALNDSVKELINSVKEVGYQSILENSKKIALIKK